MTGGVHAAYAAVGVTGVTRHGRGGCSVESTSPGGAKDTCSTPRFGLPAGQNRQGSGPLSGGGRLAATSGHLSATVPGMDVADLGAALEGIGLVMLTPGWWRGDVGAAKVSVESRGNGTVTVQVVVPGYPFTQAADVPATFALSFVRSRLPDADEVEVGAYWTAAQRSVTARRALAGSRAMPGWALAQACGDDDRDVRKIAAGNSGCPPEALRSLVAAWPDDVPVASIVAGNPGCPQDLLEDMCTGGWHAVVRRRALASPRVPEHVRAFAGLEGVDELLGFVA